MDKLTLLKKFAPKFVNAEHLNQSVRGITVDTFGHAYVTDGIQLLRVLGVYPEGSEGVLSLTGKRLEHKRNKIERLIVDDPQVAEVDLVEMLKAARHLRDVLKCSVEGKVESVQLTGLIGDLTLSGKRTDVQGQYYLGDSEDFDKHVDINRLISCLEVFDSFTTSKVFIHSPSSPMKPMQFINGDVTCLLMPVRVY